MRVSQLFLVFIAISVAENVNAFKISLAPILQLGLRLILINIKEIEEPITLTDDITIRIPEEYKNISTGSINLKNAQVYGFQTLDIIKINATDVDTLDDDNNNIINLCTNLSFDEFGFSTNYDADIGIIDEVPVYGDGEISLAVSQVLIDLCLDINISENFSQISVDNVALSFELHDSPSYITRFWKSDAVSDIVTTIINILEKVIFMWLNYEKDCVSNLISPVVQYAVNSILPNDIDDELVINSTCLQGSSGNDTDLDGLLQKLLTSYQEGRITNLISSTDVEEVKKLIQKAENNILDILINEGLSIEA